MPNTFRSLGIIAPAMVSAVCTLTISLPVARAEFTNPIIVSGADPWAMQYGGQYFFMKTNSANVSVSRSPLLQTINSNTVVAWTPPSGTMYSQQLWAPELHRINDKWYVYVAADGGSDPDHRMYVLEGDSQDPQGTYTFKGQIAAPGYANRWAIDGTVLSVGESNYFVWSGRRDVDGNGNDVWSSPQSLFIAKMDTPWSLTGNVARISDPTYSWEKDGASINEGPEVLKHNGDTFLTYSGSGFWKAYAVGTLKLTPGQDPMLASSWTKQSTPLFQGSSTTGVYAPGHASFVKSPDGTEDWIVYHARKTKDEVPHGDTRDVRIQQFGWKSNGLPDFGNPAPTGQMMASPSGLPTVTFIPNLSFERGGSGWLDNFTVTGVAGAVANDGGAFSKISNADGLKVGYLGANVAGKISQDIGPITQTAYTLSVGLAISDDQAQAATDNPAQFIMRLIGTGIYPGGSADNGGTTILGERTISSSELAVSNSRYFDLNVYGIDQDQMGKWLRVELATPDGLPTSLSSQWQVKLDMITLAVPEPTMMGLLVGLFGFGLIRPGRALKNS